MRHHASRPRAGITLIEVLAAIFIMGIGLLALLVLFPLGALSMARAVRDDRAAAAGANAAAIANALDFRNKVVLPLTYRPASFALQDPNGPGYPVYIDPFYVQLAASDLGAQSGVTPGVSRRNGGYTATADIARLFSFQEEIQFDRNGTPTDSPNSVSRPNTYTWAYLVRTPQTATRALNELAVVVYGGRSLDKVRGETTFHNPNKLGTLGSNILTLTWSGEKPKIRKGTWVLDTTYTPRTVNSTSYGSVNAFFYQVAGVRDTSATMMQVELETNLRADVKTLVVMENVITVLERGTGWKP